MNVPESVAYPEYEIEGLLTALTGVLAARVSLGADARLEEVHVLADASMHPKQIVRNIESALSAGLGVTIDRRIISVAQVRAEDHTAREQAGSRPAEAATTSPHSRDATTVADDDADPVMPDPVRPEPVAAVPAAAPRPQPDAGRQTYGRFVFVGYDARTQPDLETACRVTIRRDNDVFSGTGTGPSTALGRAQAAARAVFSAISTARDNHSLGLEGVTLVESHGRTYVLVAANASEGRSGVSLTGTAALHRSPEEAAILASLQATNRWSELDG